MSGQYLYLPLEISTQILIKLPVKFILRFRCVCKIWYSLISCPNFISDHSAQTLTQSTSHRVLVRHRHTRTSYWTLSSHGEVFVESHEHEDMAGFIVGSCDGLVCSGKTVFGTTPDGCFGYLQTFQIWNPSIRKLVQLPLRFSSPPTLWRGLYGFGFDSNGSDYKVLRQVHSNDDVLECEIYDLRKGAWRSLRPPKPPLYVQQSHSSVYLHGNLHWIGYDYHHNCTLLSFNLSIEVFRLIEMPDGAEFKKVNSYCNSRVLLINGLLSVAVLRRQMQGDVHPGFSVWSMKEYEVTESWTKLFNIELPDTLTRPGLSHPLLFHYWENGEVLIGERDTDKGENVLTLYNPKSKESKAIISTKESIDVCFYNESLALL